MHNTAGKIFKFSPKRVVNTSDGCVSVFKKYVFFTNLLGKA